MYTGNNPIAIQSREWFIEAIFALMQEKSYDKISVMDLCRKADLSRQTFYNFFRDKDDVLRLYFRKIFGRSPYVVAGKETLMISDIVNCFSGFLEKQGSILQMLIEHHLEHIISEEIAFLLFDITTRATPREERFHGYGVAFLSGAFTQMIIYWIKSSDKITTEELAELISKVLSGNYYLIHLD